MPSRKCSRVCRKADTGIFSGAALQHQLRECMRRSHASGMAMCQSLSFALVRAAVTVKLRCRTTYCFITGPGRTDTHSYCCAYVESDTSGSFAEPSAVLRSGDAQACARKDGRIQMGLDIFYGSADQLVVSWMRACHGSRHRALDAYTEKLSVRGCLSAYKHELPFRGVCRTSCV